VDHHAVVDEQPEQRHHAERRHRTGQHHQRAMQGAYAEFVVRHGIERPATGRGGHWGAPPSPGGDNPTGGLWVIVPSARPAVVPFDHPLSFSSVTFTMSDSGKRAAPPGISPANQRGGGPSMSSPGFQSDSAAMTRAVQGFEETASN